MSLALSINFAYLNGTDKRSLFDTITRPEKTSDHTTPILRTLCNALHSSKTNTDQKEEENETLAIE